MDYEINKTQALELVKKGAEKVLETSMASIQGAASKGYYSVCVIIENEEYAKYVHNELLKRNFDFVMQFKSKYEISWLP